MHILGTFSRRVSDLITGPQSPLSQAAGTVPTERQARAEVVEEGGGEGRGDGESCPGWDTYQLGLGLDRAFALALSVLFSNY